MWGLFVVLDRIDAKNDPVAEPARGAAPASCRRSRALQITPWADLKKFRADEDLYLHSYGWVDKGAGVAHLPIDKAKALLLQRGCRSRPSAGRSDRRHARRGERRIVRRTEHSRRHARPVRRSWPRPRHLPPTGTAKGTWRRPVRARLALAALVAVLLGAPLSARAQGMGMSEPPLDPASKKPLILEKVGHRPEDRPAASARLSVRRRARPRRFSLGDYFGARPVVLALAYYECPMLCTQVLNGMTGALKTLSFDAGKDFDVVVVSIDPKEGPRLAAEKKATYVEHYGRPGRRRRAGIS